MCLMLNGTFKMMMPGLASVTCNDAAMARLISLTPALLLLLRPGLVRQHWGPHVGNVGLSSLFSKVSSYAELKASFK